MSLPMTAAGVALAFNQQNTRKTWTARPNSREGLERVHFMGTTATVKLVYDVRDGTWYVQFQKVQAAWGDYIRAAARSLYVVLTTLKSAGLPFDPPTTEDDIKIICQPTDTGMVRLAWELPPTIADAVMPELGLSPLAKIDAVLNVAETVAAADLLGIRNQLPPPTPAPQLMQNISLPLMKEEAYRSDPTNDDIE